MEDYAVQNDYSGEWVKSLSPTVYTSIDAEVMRMSAEMAIEVAEQLTAEREHEVPQQPHVPRKKWGRPGDRQEA